MTKIPYRLNMGSKTRLITSCTNRRENPANLVTSRKINTRLARSVRVTIRRLPCPRPICVNVCIELFFFMYTYFTYNHETMYT